MSFVILALLEAVLLYIVSELLEIAYSTEYKTRIYYKVSSIWHRVSSYRHYRSRLIDIVRKMSRYVSTNRQRPFIPTQLAFTRSDTLIHCQRNIIEKIYQLHANVKVERPKVGVDKTFIGPTVVKRQAEGSLEAQRSD